MRYVGRRCGSLVLLDFLLGLLPNTSKALERGPQGEKMSQNYEEAPPEGRQGPNYSGGSLESMAQGMSSYFHFSGVRTGIPQNERLVLKARNQPTHCRGQTFSCGWCEESFPTPLGLTMVILSWLSPPDLTSCSTRDFFTIGGACTVQAYLRSPICGSGGR